MAKFNTSEKFRVSFQVVYHVFKYTMPLLCKAPLKFYITVMSHEFKHLERVDQQLNAFLCSIRNVKIHHVSPIHYKMFRT